MKYNHMVDIAWVVISKEKDPALLTADELIAGLLRRVADLLDGDSDEIDEAIGFCDTVEDDEL